MCPQHDIPNLSMEQEKQIQMMKESQEEMERFFKRTTLLTKLLTNPPEVDVGTTPNEVVLEENTLRLLHYIPRTPAQYPTPILVVYALINKPYILDLQPRSSVVKTLLDQGYDVYMVDWGSPRPEDHTLTLNDYINHYIDRCVDEVRKRSKQRSVTILGYCMGGTMSVMYSALHPDKVKNLIIMAAGIDFDTDAGLLHIWSRPEYFDVDKVVDTLGNIPPELLNGGYLFLDPIGNFHFKYIKFFEKIEDEEFVKMFLRMEKWTNDGIPLAGETFREFLKNGYQQNLLVQNKWKLDGKTVDLGKITMPLLNIMGEYDTLVPPEASKGLVDHVGSRDKDSIIMPVGHIGLSVSSRAHKDLWPRVGQWLAKRSGTLPRKRVPGGSKRVKPTKEKKSRKTPTSKGKKASTARKKRR